MLIFADHFLWAFCKKFNAKYYCHFAVHSLLFTKVLCKLRIRGGMS
jgi:hypothetical protein